MNGKRGKEIHFFLQVICFFLKRFGVGELGIFSGGGGIIFFKTF